MGREVKTVALWPANKRELGTISCKHIIRWQHLSRIKDASFSLIKFLVKSEKCEKMLQTIIWN